MQLDWRRLYLTADGRIGRQDFWIGLAILVAVNVLLGWIPLVNFLVHVACTYFGVCLGSKRLHDFGKSGWLMVVPSAVIAACLIFAGVAAAMAILGGVAGGEHGAVVGVVAGGIAMVGLVMLAGLINLGFLLWVGLTPSDADMNAYGPPAEPAFVNNPPPVAPPPSA